MENLEKIVYVVGGDRQTEEMFFNRDWSVTGSFEKFLNAYKKHPFSLVVFTGGEDVSPCVYGEENVGSGPCDFKRDCEEVTLYTIFSKLNVPMAGICRGGQLLNVLNGGKMIQHLGYYLSGYATCRDMDRKSYKVLVDHHQGIIRNVEKSINLLELPVGPDPTASYACYYPDLTVSYACYYPETKSLCFQPHPEWGHEPTEELFFKYIDEFFLN